MSNGVTFQHYSYSGLDPSLACDIVYGGLFEHRLLSARHSTMTHQRLASQNAMLETGRYDFPIVACGTMPKDILCVGFMAEGAETTRYNTLSIDADEIQLYPPGAELLYHATGSSRWVNLIVPEPLLQSFVTQRYGRPLELPRRDAISIRLPVGGRARLTQLTDDAFALARTLEPAGISNVLANGIFDGLLEGYATAIGTATFGDLKRMSVANQHLRLILACEHLAVSEDVLQADLDDIARRSGYSRRALELIFNRTTGMAPGRWFLNIRLNGVMRNLLTATPGTQVIDIAARWGFTHMSRFAFQYQRAFGELPSQTLRRVAGR